MMIVMAAGAAGFFASSQNSQSTALSELPLLPLHATASAVNENFCIATGPIGNNTEGVFLLDPLDGELQCTVFNPKAGAFNSLFKRNVAQDLEVGGVKGPKYLLVTGQISMQRSGLMNNAAGCVAYVVESNTGKFAAYGVPWRGDMYNRGQPQMGEMVLLDRGSVRKAAIRE